MRQNHAHIHNPFVSIVFTSEAIYALPCTRDVRLRCLRIPCSPGKLPGPGNRPSGPIPRSSRSFGFSTLFIRSPAASHPDLFPVIRDFAAFPFVDSSDYIMFFCFSFVYKGSSFVYHGSLLCIIVILCVLRFSLCITAFLCVSRAYHVFSLRIAVLSSVYRSSKLLRYQMNLRYICKQLMFVIPATFAA